MAPVKYQRFSPERLAEFIRRYPNEPTTTLAAEWDTTVSSLHARAGKLKLKKSPEYMSEGLNRGWWTGKEGVDTRFKKGHTPWHAGKKGVQFSPATQFKKGHNNCARTNPVGTERWHNGILYVKVAQGHGHKVWRAKHRLVWEAAHGPIPSGTALMFRNGNSKDISLENLELLSREEWSRRYGFATLPKDLRSVMILKKKITRVINQLEKEQE